MKNPSAVQSKQLLFGFTLYATFCVMSSDISHFVWAAPPSEVDSLATERVYWTAIGGIYSANLDGTEVTEIVDTGSALPRELDIDPVARKLYWHGNTPQRGFYRANLDGSQIEFLFESQAYSLVVDSAHGKLYWGDKRFGPNGGCCGQAILRGNLDGSNVEVLLSSFDSSILEFGSADSLDVDLRTGQFFFSGSYISIPRIWRTNLDFTQFDEIVSWTITDAIGPNIISLDRENGDIYWTDVVSESLQRTNLSSLDTETVIASGFSYPVRGLEVHPATKSIYWTRQDLGTVLRASFDGSNIEVIASGYGAPQRIVIGPAIPEPRSLYLCIIAVCCVQITFGRAWPAP